MRFSATLLLLCALWIASGSSAHAQRFTTKGTDFWLAFMDAVKFGRDTIQLNVYISSDVATSGTISMPLVGWSQPFTVAAGSVTTINLATTALVKGTESIQLQGIHVVADDSVSVFALNYVPGSADANIVLPTASLGNIYRVLAYSPYIDGDPSDPSAPHYPSEFLVIGTGDPLEIEITPAGPTLGGRPAGVPFSIFLAAGQVYQVQSDSDLTGSLVRAVGQGSDCKNFALIAGAQFTVVGFVAGTRCRYADHLVEQMYPLNTWGTEYFTVPLVLHPGTGEPRGDQIRVLAAYNGTTVTINGGAPFTLNAGEYREEFIDSPARITSTQPVAVAQYSRGQKCYQINGTDPFMIMLSPARQQLRRITFEAFIKAEILVYYLNIVTRTSATGTVRLDGIPIGNTFTPFASSPTESYARLRITQGTHTLTSDSGLLAYVYGYGSDPDDPFADVPAISYGYPAGASLDDAPPAFTPTSLVQPVNGEFCLESAIDFIAASDPFIRTWRWDFGDGATATGPAVTHTYSSAGTYTVTLIAERACYSDTLTRPITVVVPPAPAITQGCNCNTIQLRAADGFSSYRWSTGDTTQSIRITATGDYTLTATTLEGCRTGSATQHVDIVPAGPLQLRMTDANPTYAAGQTVPIVLEIKSSPADDRCGDTHDSVTFSLRFNRTLLTPPYIEGTSIIHDTIIGVDRILTIRTSADTTLLLELVAALGNVESTPIVLDSLGWDNCIPTAQRGVLGEFRLSGICREGGVRLFEANDELFIKPVRPDPATSVAEIEYGIVEPGWTEISVVNSVGQRVLVPAAGLMLPGRYLLSLDVSQLPNGIYHCVLRTRTQQIERSVRVVK